MYMYIYIYTSISLSLSLYIYIYTALSNEHCFATWRGSKKRLGANILTLPSETSRAPD